ncbi:DHS-like NAD/FAD-binding domain-containing protein, partial [Rhizopogon salebrosus TDB-379]
ISSVLEAQNLVVICGAGVSVSAGIPDFRSPQGLFATGLLNKDLLDANVWKTATKASSLCKQLAQMHEMCSQASPTTFHVALKMLDERGGVRRVYTQNIDMLEFKAGLSFGIPETMSLKQAPRCIPLHGTLETLTCQKCCYQSLLQSHISTLASGCLPPCPSCEKTAQERQITNKRPRGIGTLFPNVVLYGETHPAGEHLAQWISQDAHGNGLDGSLSADVLLVAGTSLKIPGIATAVRQFAQKVHASGSRGGYRSIYLNNEPLPSKWKDVFDVWVSGDLQIFAQYL